MLEVLKTVETLLLKRGFWVGFRNGLYQLVYDIYKMRKKNINENIQCREEGGGGLTSRVQVLWKFKLYADVNLTVNEIYVLQCKKKTP